jgi:hypothetical protein
MNLTATRRNTSTCPLSAVFPRTHALIRRRHYQNASIVAYTGHLYQR